MPAKAPKKAAPKRKPAAKKVAKKATKKAAPKKKTTATKKKTAAKQTTATKKKPAPKKKTPAAKKKTVPTKLSAALTKELTKELDKRLKVTVTLVHCGTTKNKWSKFSDVEVPFKSILSKTLATEEQKAAPNVAKGLHNGAIHQQHGKVTYLQQVNKARVSEGTQNFGAPKGKLQNLQRVLKISIPRKYEISESKVAYNFIFPGF